MEDIAVLPDPLHPLIVHFPIALVILLPIFAAGALFVIRRGRVASARRVWALPVAAAVALALSAWAAVQTGEQQEERVEDIVGDRPMHSHEEAAELFLLLSGGMVVLAAAGLAPGKFGAGARVAATIGAVALIAAGVQVGQSGGDLVYKHGAASAYTQPTRGAADDAMARTERRGEDDDDR